MKLVNEWKLIYINLEKLCHVDKVVWSITRNRKTSEHLCIYYDLLYKQHTSASAFSLLRWINDSTHNNLF